MNTPSVPFQAEPLDKLQARYTDAIWITWIVHDITQVKDRPGLHRDHVFDCEDGLRLIIAKESYGPKQPDVIHISASVDDILFKGVADHTLIDKFETRFREISGETKDLKLIAISEQGIPHWIVNDPPKK